MGERANATDATGAQQVARAGSRDRRSVTMTRRMMVLTLAVLAAVAAASGAGAQAPIESELNLITPVSKFIHDAALKAFAEYAKEKWNVAVKVNAIPAGTPIAYGRIVEWKGKPEVDIFWGGESALFFSSRRRHTIFDCDWSSDVCSSDLSQRSPLSSFSARRRCSRRPTPPRGLRSPPRRRPPTPARGPCRHRRS